MHDVNIHIIQGTVEAESVKARKLPSGVSILNFKVLTQKTFTKKDGTVGESKMHHRVVLWGKQAEFWTAKVAPGVYIRVTGSQKLNSFDGKDGQKVFYQELNADSVEVLGAVAAVQGTIAAPTQTPAPAVPAPAVPIPAVTAADEAQVTLEDFDFS